MFDSQAHRRDKKTHDRRMSAWHRCQKGQYSGMCRWQPCSGGGVRAVWAVRSGAKST